MTTDSSANPSDKPLSRRALWIMLAITLLSLGVVFFLIFFPARREYAVVEQAPADAGVAARPINRGQVLDAISNRGVEAREGYRYRVRVSDESREGSAGVARIGGLVTFIPGAHKGDILVVEITRLKNSSAEASIVRREPAAPEAAVALPPVSAVYTSVVEEIGKKGDGLTHLNGKVIFLPGTEQGDRVTYAIEKEFDRFSVGRVLSRKPGAHPRTAPSTRRPAVAVSRPSAEAVQPGAVFDVTVTEKDHKNPERDGVARIEGLVVFVPNSRPGDHVRIRITERARRFAKAEIVAQKPAETAPSPP